LCISHLMEDREWFSNSCIQLNKQKGLMPKETPTEIPATYFPALFA
jgi:hypothetical protein